MDSTFSIVSLFCGPPIAEGAELSQATHENAQKIRLSSARFQFPDLVSWAPIFWKTYAWFVIYSSFFR